MNSLPNHSTLESNETGGLFGFFSKKATTTSQAMDDKALIASLEAAITATNKNGEICPSNAS